MVSIHAPRVGGDMVTAPVIPFTLGFNPRPPRGGDVAAAVQRQEPQVSIHAPRVGGDFSAAWVRIAMAVSIHAPRVGGDLCS